MKLWRWLKDLNFKDFFFELDLDEFDLFSGFKRVILKRNKAE